MEEKQWELLDVKPLCECTEEELEEKVRRATEEENMKGGREMRNASIDVTAMDEVYDAGRREAVKAKAELETAKLEHEALGKIKAANYNIKANELLKYVTLYQLKKDKEHRKQGRTWEEFCRLIGESDRTVDLILKEIGPIAEQFSAKLAETFDMPFNKIRYLGRSVSANFAEISDNTLQIGDHRIELTPENKDEIEAAIDEMKQSREREMAEHKKEVEKLEKKLAGAATEETKALKAERDILSKEVARLKVFDPEEKDPSWSLDQIKEIEKRCAEFTTYCGRFILDERLDEHPEIQGRIEGVMKTMEIAFMDLRGLWEERFTSRFGEQI